MHTYLKLHISALARNTMDLSSYMTMMTSALIHLKSGLASFKVNGGSLRLKSIWIRVLSTTLTSFAFFFRNKNL